MLTNRFKKILVSLDGSANSRRGMNEAISLARQSEGTITGITVVPSLPSEIAQSTQGYKNYLHEKAKTFLNDAKTNAARHGIEFEEQLMTSDDIANAISNYAKLKKFDIIVIGARGQSSPKSEYFGSISNGILHNSRTPVLVVK